MMKIDNDVDEGRPPDSRSEQPRILSRLRNLNNLAMNSISSLFSGPLSSIGRPRDFDSAAGHDYDLWNSAYDLEMARTPNALEENDQFLAQYDQDIQDVKNLTAEASTPTQTRSNSPLHSNRFQDVKNTFTSFARSRQTDFYGQMHSGYPLLDESQHPPLVSSTTLSSIVSASVSCSDHFVTPPLTPDIIDDHILLSPEATSYGQDIRYDPYCSAGRPIDNDEDTPRTQPYSLEIKEGKKPERLVVRGIPFHPWHTSAGLVFLLSQCYDSVIDDVPGLHKARSAASTKSQVGATTDDRDEWYGLEYTLELSSRERRPSDTQSLSPGEHSKVVLRSRQSRLFTIQYRAVNHGPRSIKAPSTHFSRMRTTINGRIGIGTLIVRMREESIRKAWSSRRDRSILRGSTLTSSLRETSCIGSRYYALG